MAKRKRQNGQVVLIMAVTLLVVLVALTMAAIGKMGRGPIGDYAASRPAAILSSTPPPPVIPIIYEDKTPDAARASNAAVPVVAAGLAAAPSLRFAGTTADRDAAEACLTAAVLYEAGDDPPGEKAVAQVVLNRARHPAFPKTVCGVVLQGSERRTGCQFTFTCDGALARTPSPDAWVRARRIADAALGGAVYKEVGTATHYHTDWVVPYWRSSLEKIAIVHTQIFYRWPGAWGSRAAISGSIAPGEQPNARIVALAGLKDAPAVQAAATNETPPAQSIAGMPVSALRGNTLRVKDEEGGVFLLQLTTEFPPGGYASAAFNLCGDKLECTVYGWVDAADVPRSLPISPPMLRTLAFAYRKSHSMGLAQAYWDCKRFPRPVKAECLID